MAHRDCDHCDSTEPVTHRVTPWHAGQRQEPLHAYTCADCAEAHRDRLHSQGYGCVEIRPVIAMNQLAEYAEAHMREQRANLPLDETVILEDVPERA